MCAAKCAASCTVRVYPLGGAAVVFNRLLSHSDTKMMDSMYVCVCVSDIPGPAHVTICEPMGKVKSFHIL